jgi:hypothetical protein
MASALKLHGFNFEIARIGWVLGLTVYVIVFLLNTLLWPGVNVLKQLQKNKSTYDLVRVQFTGALYIAV